MFYLHSEAVAILALIVGIIGGLLWGFNFRGYFARAVAEGVAERLEKAGKARRKPAQDDQ